jgi:alcohol dehydrogenase class IV
MFVIFCRIFQFVFNIAARVLPWRKAIVIDGQGSINKVPELLQKHNVTRPLLVTDNGLVKAGIAKLITDVLDKASFTYVVFSDVEPNPSVNTVNKIQQLYLKKKCN